MLDAFAYPVTENVDRSVCAGIVTEYVPEYEPEMTVPCPET
jgi:hypothetical protein